MNAPHWLRRPGFGAGLTDFEAYASSDPNFQAAWGEIQAQLNVEGAGATILNSAKTAFVNSFEQIAGQGFSTNDPIGAAKSYVMTGQTILGAVNTVTGLVESLQNTAPQEVIQQFTGVMVGLATAGGALSAGIGAAIVVGVEIAIDVMQSAGLFPAPTHCDYPAGSLCLTSNNSVRVPPGSTNWRRFPDPNNPADAVWFRTSGPFAWGDLAVLVPGLNGGRPINLAFPNYPAIEAMAAKGDQFQKAFVAAWKGNAEFLLNGLKPQPDYQVLIHALRLWNRTHTGPAYTVQEMYAATSPYLFSLTSDATTYAGAGDGILNGQPPPNSTVVMNTGALIIPPSAQRVIALHIPASLDTFAPAPTPSSTGLSTGAKVAVGGAALGGAALLGAAAFAFAKGQAVDLVLKHAWKHVRSWF